MKIKIVSSKKEWEDFISKQECSSVFHSWNWAEFEKSLGNSFDRYGIYKKGKLIGLIPIKYIYAKRGRYLHLRHGPLFDFEDDKLWKVFFKFIIKKAKEHKVWFIRMSPLILEDLELEFVDIFSHFQESPMHDVDAEITWVLDLSQSEEEILEKMRKNTRYYIRRAERDGVRIVKTKTIRYMKEFWKIYSDTVKRQKWTAYPREYIVKEFKTLSKDNQVEMYLAEYKSKYIAASIVIYYRDQAIYHHSGTLTEYQKIPANYLIQWEAIKESKRRGLKWYNFWGISPLVMEDGEYKAKAGHPWAGLTFFKLGFGGQVRQFIHAKDLPISKMYCLTRFFERIERWKRGY